MSSKRFPTKNPHMSADDFRRGGHKTVDWAAKYMDEVRDYPVLSGVKPGEVRQMLPPRAPLHPESIDEILADLDRIILPGVTHWQSPGFFAFFPGNTSGPSILAEIVSAALGVQGMMWVTSPACTELETHMTDWLVEMLHLPGKFSSRGTGGGMIQDSASSASLCALLAAREWKTGGTTNTSGMATSRQLVAYCSDHTHSSVDKAVRIAGIGQNQLRKIPVDDNFALRADLLETTIRQDLEQGLVPFFACATLGTTSSTAVDPVPAMADLCTRYGLWLHVDAAMCGTAAICPEFQWLHQGLEDSHSYCFNPHKWMLVNFDCCCFYVGERRHLVQALGISPDYLQNPFSESGETIDYRDWQIPLGRRFRALKLWFVIRSYGIEGLQRVVREHVRLADLLAEWVRKSSHFELMAPVPFNLVCFRHRRGDSASRQVLDRVNRSGRIYLTHTRLRGHLTLRMCIGQRTTTESDVRMAWDLLCEAAR